LHFYTSRIRRTTMKVDAVVALLAIIALELLAIVIKLY
jgi:hypothetical protein